MPYYRKDKEGNPIPKHLQAQNIADFWANKIWKEPEEKSAFTYYTNNN